MREKIFRWLVRNHPEGTVLTKPQLFIRDCLFPIQRLIEKSLPYNRATDVWTIHGKKYTGKALYDLANANGCVFRITQQNDCTVLERLDSKIEISSKNFGFE